MTTITFRLPKKLAAQLEALVRSERGSISALVREALEERLRAAKRRHSRLSAYELVKHLCGSIKGPSDLATNPKYMEGFGN